MPPHTTDAPTARTPIPGVLTALLAWVGLLFVLVGLLDSQTEHSEFARTWVLDGGIAVAIGALATVILARLGFFRAGKSAVIALGLSPFLIFGLFIFWRMNVSGEQRAHCFQRDDAEACRVLAEVRAKRGHAEDAVALFEHGCALGNGPACRALGGQVNRNAALHAQPPLHWFSRACELGDGLGCDRAGHLTRTSDLDASKAFFERGCDLGYLSSCH